ncbi:MAG: hypothetical protein PUB37_04680 [Firmicutes bacterium]|nr:hypothetical protein [Bacillota bacterium]
MALRKNSPALKCGELKFTVVDDARGILVYEKSCGDEKYCIAINLGATECKILYSEADKLTGLDDLIHDRKFDGVLQPLDFAVIKVNL